MRKNPIILPYDGHIKIDSLEESIRRDLSEIDVLKLISYLKFNDAFHMQHENVSLMIQDVICDFDLADRLGIFFDLKLADTSGTVKNIAAHYKPYTLVKHKILTVRSNLSGKGYLELRRALPDVQIALVSFLTDNSVEDCLEQYGLFPEEKILHDMRIVQRKYRRVCQEEDNPWAFDMVVCSPLELPYLERNCIPIFGWDFDKITPGIRDDWMTKGQQSRISGVAQALLNGAEFVVMGSQMQKGNPDRGISAAKSRQLTAEEIEKAHAMHRIEIASR